MSWTPAGKWAAGISLGVLGVGVIGAIAGNGEEDLALSSPRSSVAADPVAEPATSTTAVTAANSVVVVKQVVVTQRLPYTKRTVRDSSMALGTRKVTAGRSGYRVKTYDYRYQNGQVVKRTLRSSVITRAPVSQVTRLGTHVAPKPLSSKSSGGCDPNYSGACVPIASDVDCAGGSGNGPAYVAGPVEVTGADIYDLDRDGDGIGCE